MNHIRFIWVLCGMQALCCVLHAAIAQTPTPPPASASAPVALRCEYDAHPLGIDSPQPRLSWRIESGERGARQTAYQILVASTEEAQHDDRGDLWNSGKVISDQSVFVDYAGQPLKSRQGCFWKVRIWDQSERSSDWSTPASWRMGLRAESDWTGRWITSDLELKEYQKTLRAMTDFGMEPETEIRTMIKKCRQMTADVTEAPAVWFRKEFDAPKTVRRATVSVSGLGLFELYVNGRRISDHQLDPAYTDYQKRVFYLTHDVTADLKPGKNALGVVVGNGWFNLITPHVLRYYTADYIAPPRLRLDLDIEFDDGTHEFVGSDDTWKCTTDGPIRFNCILAGETYDARREMPGWAEVNFNALNWKPAQSATPPDGRLVSQQLRPVRRIKELPAVSVTKEGENWRFDLGVETTGRPKLRVRGTAGESITIKMPGSEGHTLGRYQTCQYVFRSADFEEYEPRFCTAGYRYVDVGGLSYAPDAADCIGQLVSTDLEPAGAFACSDARLNSLQEILLRTLQNYIVHIPNDPTREKAGWTQDVESTFTETAYNFTCATVYTKWQRDFLDIIHPNGYMPPVAPGRFDGPTINGPWWGGAVIYTPWYLYEFYGDRGILVESYPAMKAQFGYLDSIAESHIVRWGLGDWMEVGSVRPVRTPVPLTSTCAYYWFACILRDTATMLGKPDEAEHFATAAADIRTAYNSEFFNPETGDYASGSQTCQLVSLLFGLVPDDKRDQVRQRLAERVKADNGHLTTGFVGTPLLLPGLTELGMPKLAWTIATQTDYPSFIDAILNRGNTVMKEDWTGGQVQMPSLQGPIGTWFYQSLAGIRRAPSAPGFKHIVIKPEIENTLTWVKAHHDSPYGRIASGWRHEGDTLTLDITVPPNATGTVYVPTDLLENVTEGGKPVTESPGVDYLRMENGRAVFRIGSGSYQFASKVKTVD